MNEKYCCPVCAFPELDVPPVDFNICPSCGTEFGYDDCSISWEDLREEWIRNGASWFSDDSRPPPGWSAYAQLAAASLLVKSEATGESTNEFLGADIFAYAA